MIFSKKLWESIHENPFIKAALDNHCLWGEDCHRDNSEVLFENVAIRINDFHCEPDGLLCGDLDLMDTQKGLIIYSLAKTGAIIVFGTNIKESQTANAPLKASTKKTAKNPSRPKHFPF